MGRQLTEEGMGTQITACLEYYHSKRHKQIYFRTSSEENKKNSAKKKCSKRKQLGRSLQKCAIQLK